MKIQIEIDGRQKRALWSALDSLNQKTQENGIDEKFIQSSMDELMTLIRKEVK